MAKKSTKTTPTSSLSYDVATMLETPRVPRGLGEQGQRLWTAVQGQYDISDAGGVELLRLACLACDRAERLRKIINSDGELVEGKDGAPAKEHPLLRAEHLARSYISQTLSRLGLNLEPLRPGAGRPPGRSGAI
jgi:hypothetical protein